MKRIRKIKERLRKFLLDHSVLKTVLEWVGSLFITALSAFVFAYGFRSFIAPNREGVPHLISGGASGLSQVIVAIVNIFAKPDAKLMTSILYFVINIPIFILAWFKIGKRFTILTFCNVLLVSLFNEVLPEEMTEIFSNVVEDGNTTVNIYNMSIDFDPIARALFAGILTGIHSSLAYLIGASAGGMDVVALYIAEKKSTSIGKYTMSINATIVLSYVLANVLNPNLQNTTSIIMALYTCIYFFTSSKVIDVLNTKNKKTELQIFTSSDQMAAVLLHAFPHGCTIVDAKGGYTGSDKKIIYMVVSHNEVKKAIKIMRDVDENCFVTVVNSYQVYGKFYIRPIR